MTDSHILGGIMFDYSTNADYNQWTMGGITDTRCLLLMSESISLG
jgi:hypothetical protein